MPAKYTGQDVGRITKGAAKSLLGKVYLTIKDFSKAEIKLQEVTTMGYSLLPKFNDLFDYTKNEHHNEYIFDIEFEEGISLARETHTPVLFHVEDITQPQGHSTSGSHERYKDKERLQWEREWDGLIKLREWLLANSLTSEDELEEIEKEVKEKVRDKKNEAWQRFLKPIKDQVNKSVELINDAANKLPAHSIELKKLAKELGTMREPMRRNIMRVLNSAIEIVQNDDALFWLKDFYAELQKENASLYNTHLYDESEKTVINVAEVKPQYNSDSPLLNGYEILNRFFDQLFAANLLV